MKKSVERDEVMKKGHESDKPGKKSKSSCKDDKVDHRDDDEDNSDNDERSMSTRSKGKDKISKLNSSKMTTRRKGKSAPAPGTSGNTDNLKLVGKQQTSIERKKRSS